MSFLTAIAVLVYTLLQCLYMTKCVLGQTGPTLPDTMLGSKSFQFVCFMYIVFIQILMERCKQQQHVDNSPRISGLFFKSILLKLKYIPLDWKFYSDFSDVDFRDKSVRRATHSHTCTCTYWHIRKPLASHIPGTWLQKLQVQEQKCVPMCI